jgi:hypothetical protein
VIGHRVKSVIPLTFDDADLFSFVRSLLLGLVHATLNLFFVSTYSLFNRLCLDHNYKDNAKTSDAQEHDVPPVSESTSTICAIRRSGRSPAGEVIGGK